MPPKKVLVDEGDDELVNLPVTEVHGSKPHKDGSVLFNMIGGPLHGRTVRMYSPFMRAVFSDGEELAVYKLHPPVRKGGLWVYAHDATDETEPTEEELGDHDQVARDARLARWAEYQKAKRDRVLESFSGNFPIEYEGDDDASQDEDES